MTVKTNDATHNRPAGKRLIDAPAVMIDINKVISQIKGENAWDSNDRNGITVFKGDGLSMVISAFHKGTAIKDLQVDGIVVLQVLQGVISIMKDDETVKLQENQVLVIHSPDEHTMEAEEETIVLLTAVKTASI